MENLWKGIVSAQFRAKRPKLCGNCAFPQNIHARKLGEITVFFAVLVRMSLFYKKLFSLNVKTNFLNRMKLFYKKGFNQIEKLFQQLFYRIFSRIIIQNYYIEYLCFRQTAKPFPLDRMKSYFDKYFPLDTKPFPQARMNLHHKSLVITKRKSQIHKSK